jgi:hypothetical protein
MFGVLLLKALGSLTLAPLLERLVLRKRANTDTPPFSIRTVRTMRTGVTVTHRELDPNHAIFTLIDRRIPIDTCASGWTSRLPCVPVNHKIGGSKAFVFLPLPPLITTNWAEQIEVVLLLTFDQQLGINVAHVGEMYIRQQIALVQRLVNPGGHCIIGWGRDGGFHVRNQMRQICITAPTQSRRLSADGGQHVGGVAALPTSRTQQVTRAKSSQQGKVSRRRR